MGRALEPPALLDTLVLSRRAFALPEPLARCHSARTSPSTARPRAPRGRRRARPAGRLVAAASRRSRPAACAISGTSASPSDRPALDRRAPARLAVEHGLPVELDVPPVAKACSGAHDGPQRGARRSRPAAGVGVSAPGPWSQRASRGSHLARRLRDPVGDLGTQMSRSRVQSACLSPRPRPSRPVASEPTRRTRPPLAQKWLDRAEAGYKNGDFDDAEGRPPKRCSASRRTTRTRASSAGRLALARLDFADGARVTEGMPDLRGRTASAAARTGTRASSTAPPTSSTPCSPIRP